MYSPSEATATDAKGDGGAYQGPYPSDTTATAAASAGDRASGGKTSRLGKRPSSRRQQTAPTPQQAVVVNVPLPDLDQPIVAHLDANHQIVSTHPMADGADEAMDMKI